MHKAFIALGSNLDNPYFQIQRAIEQIQKIDEIEILNKSSLYETEPIGYLNQPKFINAVISIKCKQNPYELLEKLQNIEKKQKRERIIKNGPRTIDLDLLLFDDMVTNDEYLTLPHPRMHERDFVMIPLIEIEPNINIPTLNNLSLILSKMKDTNIKKL